MVIGFIAENIDAARLAYRAWSDEQKHVWDSVVRLDADTFDVVTFVRAMSEDVLFGGKTKVVLDGVINDVVLLRESEEIGNGAFVVGDQTDVVVIDEINNKEKIKKIFPTIALTEVATKKTYEKEVSNFDLVDAVLAKDKKKAWLLLRARLEAGAVAEEIHGSLVWGYKQAVLVLGSKNAEEAGVKPFVYGKTKRLIGSATKEDVQHKLFELVEGYGRAREGDEELISFIERFILAL